MRNLLLCIIFLLSSQICYGASTNFTLTLVGTTTTNPTGTSTSAIKLIEGYSRMKGWIVVNSSSSPYARINQAVDATSASTGLWHGTTTISWTSTGGFWRGEIDDPIFGQYAQLVIGTFGTATFNKVNWYASIETSVSTTLSTVVTGTVTATKSSVSSATNNVIIATNSSTTLLSSNTSRKYLLLVNTGTANDCYFMLAATATTGSGTVLSKNGGSFELDFTEGIYTGAISGITSSGTTSVAVLEY